MKTFSNNDRTKALRSFETEVFDLVIVGGGINGAGIARDACSRGMRVALVEASDFASGTSSRSSKLIHGGIRYLENLEFHLVFEALSERAKLFSIAPHLVHPLRFMIPLYKGGRVGMTTMGLGMWVYDALSLFEAPELHERLSAAESLKRQPLMQGSKLLGSYVYSDAYMDDDRLVLETLRSCPQEKLSAASYVKAMGVEQNAQLKVCGIRCLDQVTQKSFTLRGRHFVSTVGPWTDQFGEKIHKDWKSVLRPTKGVHLTFEKKRLPLSSAVVMGAENRIVFGMPRHEMVIVGTTDTDFQGDPATVSATPEDVRYLLGVIDQYFPAAKITAQDIIASYAGVRPLVRDQSTSEGATSREHQIWTDPSGVTFVAGGKYTTYRRIAEQAVHHCLKSFEIEDRVRFRQSRTEEPLNPLVTTDSMCHREIAIRELRQDGRLSDAEAGWLFDRHGGEAREILRRYGGLGYWELEARHAIDQLMCFHLVDFFTRRIPAVLSRIDHGEELLDLVAQVFAEKLGWSVERIQSEKSEFKNFLSREFKWKEQLISKT